MIFAAVVWIEAPAQAEAFQVGFICFVFVCVFACIGKAWRLSVPHGQDTATERHYTDHLAFVFLQKETPNWRSTRLRTKRRKHRERCREEGRGFGLDCWSVFVWFGLVLIWTETKRIQRGKKYDKWTGAISGVRFVVFEVIFPSRVIVRHRYLINDRATVTARRVLQSQFMHLHAEYTKALLKKDERDSRLLT